MQFKHQAGVCRNLRFCFLLDLMTLMLFGATTSLYESSTSNRHRTSGNAIMFSLPGQMVTNLLPGLQSHCNHRVCGQLQLHLCKCLLTKLILTTVSVTKMFSSYVQFPSLEDQHDAHFRTWRNVGHKPIPKFCCRPRTVWWRPMTSMSHPFWEATTRHGTSRSESGTWNPGRSAEVCPTEFLTCEGDSVDSMRRYRW